MIKSPIILNENINLNEFFNQGYTVSSINLDLADILLQKVKRQYFKYPSVLSETEHPVYRTDTNLFYCECVTSFTLPEGENVSSPQMGMEFLEEDKKFFNDFWKDLEKESYFRSLTNSTGTFSQLSKQIMHYNKNDGLSWHYDFKDASFMINMIYLTDEVFTEEDGSYLEFGVCYYKENEDIKKENVTTIGKIIPKHGLIVTANNMNPNFVHRVPFLKTNKQRYSLICQFGYSTNVLYSLKAKNWNIV